MQNEQHHRGFVISWEEPPATANGWIINVASSVPALQAKLEAAEGGHGAKVIEAQTRDEGIAEAIVFLNNMLA